ncbi:hypothetical protein MKZ38_003371 [Zalerion maritima]|uniref:Uncharacterized protein n=1 Tax=Zalerion maritima TaxID=339359 RepID=A0AAD5RUI5_9PEZI|nr:hypothetical protein MKZ38_003371 [Zalerion maritima]
MKVSLWRNATSPARPRTGGQSTVRGKTISNPIPIPSPLDDEFPIRNPGTGVATQVGDEHHDGERPLAPPPPGASTLSTTQTQDHAEQGTMPMPMSTSAPSQPEREPPAVPVPPEPVSREYHARGQSFSATLPRPSTSPPRSGNSPPRHQSSPPKPRDSPPRRTNVNSTVRYSTVSAASTGQTGNSRDAPQRKKSTLRTALGKLFGRRKKTAALSSIEGSANENMAHMPSTSQHRSTALTAKDPTALSSRPADRDRGSEPKRSASLPITEFDRALRSHSIGPDDITAIESARNSIQADPGTGRRRGATSSGRLFQIQRTEGWGGLSPRPASTHGRGSRLLSGMELEGGDDPDKIGMAITSDLGSRRRSRSLSGLGDIESQLVDVRKRSEEIRYWRESYDPGFLSPLSSNAPDGDNDGDGDGDEREKGNEKHSSATNTGRDASATIPEISAIPHHLGPNSHPIVPHTPPQPFTFPGTVASMNEMAGMKITHAASIETRIHSLEFRMHTLERVVHELCQSSASFPMRQEPSSPQRPATSDSPAAPGLGIAVSDDRQPASSFTTATTSVPPIPAVYSTTDNSSYLSFGEAPTFTESIYPHATTASAIPPYLQSTSRPTSNSTVRGATSLPQLHIPPRTSEERDEYANLVALITAEQNARLALEAKVRSLTTRVDFLSSSGNGPSSGATPQHIRIPVRQQDAPETGKSLGTFSAFDEDSDDEDEAEREGRLAREATAVEASVDDDASYSEAFETPREEITPGTAYGYGAFGEELREDDGEGGRKAARTLSLSQLTLGKKAGEEIPDVPETPTGPTANQGINF